MAKNQGRGVSITVGWLMAYLVGSAGTAIRFIFGISLSKGNSVTLRRIGGRPRFQFTSFSRHATKLKTPVRAGVAWWTKGAAWQILATSPTGPMSPSSAAGDQTAAASLDSRIQVFLFARNFGHQPAHIQPGPSHHTQQEISAALKIVPAPVASLRELSLACGRGIYVNTPITTA